MRYLAASAVVLGLAGSGLAETWTVDDDGPADFDTIQAAVDAASDGDAIHVFAGLYTSTQDGHVVNTDGKAITLIAPAGPELTTIDGEGARRGIACYSGENEGTYISGFTITNGWGAPFDYNANNELDSQEDCGGGMFILSSRPRVIGCIFHSNESDDDGGAVHLDGSNASFVNCQFTDNTSGYGGGAIYCGGSYPTLFNCSFTGNSAAAYGGGIWIRHCYSEAFTLRYCAFTGNIGSSGGGIACTGNSSPDISQSTFSKNSAGSGGGMYISSICEPVVSDCEFSSNTAESGGGMYNGQSSALLLRCSFTDNFGETAGGLYNSGNPEVLHCDFFGNSSENKGAAISNFNTAGTLISHCSFQKNAAPNGAICNQYSTPIISNCIIQDNTASSAGGGIFHFTSGIFPGDYPSALSDTIVCGNVPDQIDGNWSDNGNNYVDDECFATCPGDFTDSGFIDVEDLLLVISNWQNPYTVEDLLLVISEWNTTCP